MNQVILIGRLGKDAELKSTSGGTDYCTFSLATSESWVDKNTGVVDRLAQRGWHW